MRNLWRQKAGRAVFHSFMICIEWQTGSNELIIREHAPVTSAGAGAYQDYSENKGYS